MSSKRRPIVFSDVDGTLVHYPKHFAPFGEIVSVNRPDETAVYRDKESGQTRDVWVLGSLTSGDSYISQHAIDLVNEIRAAGAVFVIISGMRYTTWRQRRPLLPPCDAIAIENGGRIFYHGTPELLNVRAQLDLEWMHSLTAVTGPQVAETPPAQRQGPIWDLYRQLHTDGWWCDAEGYVTSFRVDAARSPGKTLDELIAVQKTLPPLISSTFNLGKADFYPASSGKGNTVQYLMRHFGVEQADSFALFDDDNDIEMGKQIAKCFLPGPGAVEIQTLAKEYPHWTISQAKGILGIEEGLESILAQIKQRFP